MDVEQLTYKHTPQTDLNLYIVHPPNKATCAIVFFFCGGWNGFDHDKFYAHSAYFSSRGALCVSAEVRVMERHGTRPQECVIDARSALRYVRRHAEEWGFPPDKIVAAGGSAAGHVSLSTAMVPGFEEEAEKHDIHCTPDLVCAYNPAVLPPLDVCTSSEDRIKLRVERFGSEADMLALSPCENVRPGLPPVILLTGDADDVTPLADTAYFHETMQAAGNVSELKIYAGGGHGFFNYNPNGNHYFDETTRDVERFLMEHGFLTGASTFDDFSYTPPDA